MPDTCRLRVVFLGSGSSGNATAVSDGETTLLIDCGFSAREVSRRMTLAGLIADDVSAILLTHEHLDHLRGVDVFARRHACAVHATRGTRMAAGLDHLPGEVVTVVAGEPIRIGTLSVVPFRTSHDSAEPVGYLIESDAGERFGLATDTGVLTAEAAEALSDVDILGIESNHDLLMLEQGPYPAFLKRRIRSAEGHLSNPDAADALERLASGRLRRVFALHRSDTNNTPSLAKRALVARLTAIDLGVPVEVAPQHEPLDANPPQGALFDGGGAE
ncbi:MAG: MBL fold metallo-hydrolase [Coriobacteriia bacterium]|nr:MBL fold metallo-hydrolase [Coriobacteriia bacterium]